MTARTLATKALSATALTSMAITAVVSLPLIAEEIKPQYLQLKDRLDRPLDGYCFDVQGVVGHFRADKPLVAHNCKRGAAPDGLVQLTDNNMLYFPAFQQCVTAMGTGTTVLPGISLMLKACIESGPFGSPAMQKRFQFNEKEQLQLMGTRYCVVAGAESSHTLSRYDSWRPLFLSECTSAPLALSQWQLFPL